MQVKQSPVKHAPIKAYLRIRPVDNQNSNSNKNSYLRRLNDTEIEMIPPKDSYRNRNGNTEKYRFTKILESLPQQTFFKQTTFPLIKDVFENNDNALIFAYGVTNSGKTFTVMGNQKEPGILPRTLNTIFKSIQHLTCHDCKLKPFMYSGIQTYKDIQEENRHLLIEKEVEGEEESIVFDDNDDNDEDESMNSDSIEEKEVNEIHVDDNYRYSIWVSFIEIYNEKIYDLLESKPNKNSNSKNNNKNQHTKRNQLALKYEGQTGNKYIQGQIKVKVHSIQEAIQIMRLGQKNRQVFSTLMNQESSRSHSIFAIELVKCPVTEKGRAIHDMDCAQTLKMSIVDLAGSERYRNTNSSGARLKEAGNINKSLMILGQCMETLRSNQWKLEMGKPASIVPFRQSKLTEIFKSAFQGDGKVAIIVNINPMETGFDENSHVMKFAAVAKDVKTWQQIQPKLDLQSLRGAVKRSRSHSDDDEEEEEEEEEDAHEWDYLIDTTALEIENLKNMLIESDTQKKALEAKLHYSELAKVNEYYLNDLKNEASCANCEQIKKELETTIDENDQFTFQNIYKKQDQLEKKIDFLQTKISNSFDHQSLLDKISQLEAQCNKQKEENQQLISQFDQYHANQNVTMKTQKLLHHSDQEEEEEESNSMTGESVDENLFIDFLTLRKRLRRSIFKKEELSEDADEIMNQVEQFEGVTFKLAKETKMGKLLKLIAQEDFQSDPYQIKTRATNLFKRYARLPTKVDENTPVVPQETFSNMTLADSEENRWKTPSKNQIKLLRVIDKTRLFCHLREKNQLNHLNNLPKQLLLRNNSDMLVDDNSFTDESDTDNSQFTEVFKQKPPAKRKRKLRA